jgi:flagellar export protein FliJ
MKKFKFTLQSVHNVREIREEKELMVLSGLNLEAERASEKVAQVEGALKSAVENYNRKSGAGEPINVIEMELNSRHISALERQKVEARTQLREKQNACSDQMVQVTHAAQQVKITNRLRENQASDYRLNLARHEQSALDEMATTGFARKLGESR